MRIAILLLAACGSAPAVVSNPATPHGALALPVLTGQTGTCGAFETARDTLDVVDGRLKVVAPKGSADVPRAYDIMSAPEPTEHESRVIVEDKRGGKLVVFVQELWQTAPADLAAASATYFASLTDNAAVDIGRIDAAPDLAIAAAAPKQPDTSREAVLVLATVVRTPDNTLLAVEYYVNPQAYADGCRGLAIDLASRLAPGKRALDQAGGKRTLGGFDVDVPAGFVVTHKPGPDFDVYFVRKLAPLGNFPGYLLVYEGDYADTEVPTGDGNPVSRPGKLAGVDTTYAGYAGESGGRVMATVNVGHGQLQVIEIATQHGEFLGELDGIAKTIRMH